MSYEDRIKREIKERLAALPKFRIDCVWCKKHCATMTRPMELIHYECWRQYQFVEKTRKKQLLAAVIEKSRQKPQ